VTLLSVSTYLPTGDLIRIIAATLLVAVLAPCAVAVGITGIERREAGAARVGNALVAIGAGGLTLLVAIGLYALTQR
jgi:hypothetical protein